MGTTDRATITAFENSEPGRFGDRTVLAVDEDGFVIAGHMSSSTMWAKRDIGVSDLPGRATWKDDAYNDRYPDGWVVEWTDDRERIEALHAKSMASVGGDE